MKKMYTRVAIREIKHSLGRFTAIIAIVALGVGFLVGLLSTTPDMKASMNAWYDKQSMYDFNIKSTMGLTEDDISAVSALSFVSRVMPAKVTDVLMTDSNGDLLTARLYGMELSEKDGINNLTLLEGRLPESPGECVIENPNTYMSDLSIGDTLTLSDDNENSEDTYAQNSFTITGIVDSPVYYCNFREPSSVGTGHTDVILYADDSAYALDTYTDLFLTVKNKSDAFTSEYTQQMNSISDKLKTLSKTRIQIRYKEIQEEAQEEIDKAKKKLNQEKQKAEKELADAKEQLDQAQEELDQGVTQLNAAKEQLHSGQEELAEGKKQLKEGKKQVKQARKELDTRKEQLDASKDEIEEAKAAQEAGYPLSEEVLAQIEAYDEGLSAWEKGNTQLNRQSQKLEKSEKKIAASEENLKTAEKEIADNEAKIQKGEAELASGRAEYEDGKKEAEAEIQKAEKKIRKAEQEIDELEEPEWYILDRNSNVSYARYKIDVEKVGDIATVFPVFFFLVAALVSLTTMTRMVEEERIQIGTLKALGYRKSTIMTKYLIYCGGAAVLGCAIGLAAGFKLLPAVIYEAYASQYALPELVLQFSWQYALLSCGLEILCTIGATWLACSHTMREKPAALMVARAPKAGKRIMLERVGFIWKHLSFTYKATARNVFRYKKHLFMTVIGIAGCTGLMVAGFGIHDSMSHMITNQYSSLFKYDMKIELSEDKSDSVLKKFLSGKDSLKICSLSGEVSAKGTDQTISTTICIPENLSSLDRFITLRDRKSQETVPFTEQAVVMTEKMASDLGLSPGDSFMLTNADDMSAEFVLTGITENYLGCYVYMDPALYTDAFGPFDYNGYYLKSGITDLDKQEDISRHLQDSEYVSSCEFTSQSRESYESTLSNINIIVYVLILCAGALAVVVLYNLTNININERSRELATLRVLGYHHREVAGYIFREIGLLSILGTVVGLGAGWCLHRYVIVIAESVDFMMGREISLSSYLLAAAFTLLFSALVDVIMLFKLQKIQMVESMKAVD